MQPPPPSASSAAAVSPPQTMPRCARRTPAGAASWSTSPLCAPKLKRSGASRRQKGSAASLRISKLSGSSRRTKSSQGSSSQRLTGPPCRRRRSRWAPPTSALGVSAERRPGRRSEKRTCADR
uniref:Uncharacterized protein n=1 Tax=Macrostomum lignano TaxID=282301 RepID=A0A1I8H2W7_9PLAT